MDEITYSNRTVLRFGTDDPTPAVTAAGYATYGAYRSDLTEEEWDRIRPVLPAQKPKTGRPAHNHRVIVNGIFWVLRTGAPWRHMPERYGPWSTIASRYHRWRHNGVWYRVLKALDQQTPSTYSAAQRLVESPAAIPQMWDDG
jgi:transposase